MADVVSLAEKRPFTSNGGPKQICFDRTELRKLLDVYSRRVATGEWRDYAIQHRPDMAAFAVFRSTNDQPLFVVAKYPPGTQRQGTYAVTAGARRLSHGWNIDEVLSIFERGLRLAT